MQNMLKTSLAATEHFNTTKCHSVSSYTRVTIFKWTSFLAHRV